MTQGNKKIGQSASLHSVLPEGVTPTPPITPKKGRKTAAQKRSLTMRAKAVKVTLPRQCSMTGPQAKAEDTERERSEATTKRTGQ